MSQSHVCPSCETLQARGDGFCVGCGTQLLPARYCDTCGVRAAHRGEYCRECGGRLPALPAEPVPAPKPPPAPQADRPPPKWLTEPEPAPEPAPRPAPRAPAPAPAPPKASPPAKAPAAPPSTMLTRRPSAAPVPMRTAPLATQNSNAVGSALGIAGGLAGMSGLLLIASNPVLGAMLVLMMFVLAGQQTRAASARAVDRFVEWVWDDPVLRHRLLGE